MTTLWECTRLQEQVWTPSAGWTTTRYAYDAWDPATPSGVGNENWKVWATLDGNNNLETRYINGDALDQVFAQISAGGNVAWYSTDRLGSTVALVDNNGNLLDAITYDAWGNITSQTNSSAQPLFTFAGMAWDETLGLDYDKSRFYAPSDGRFINQDPTQFAAGDSNLYRYVDNDPTNAVDPSGLEWWPKTRDWFIIPPILEIGWDVVIEMPSEMIRGWRLNDKIAEAKQARAEKQDVVKLAMEAKDLSGWQGRDQTYHPGVKQYAENAQTAAQVGTEIAMAMTPFGLPFSPTKFVFAKTWAEMSQAERAAFQHAYDRHKSDLGLPKWMHTDAEALRTQYNQAVANIRKQAQSVKFERHPVGVKGSGEAGKWMDVRVYEYTDANGVKFYYSETIDGRFVSAGRVR